eukprot:TRINITY_DN1971_c0_g1_i1.p1 TRINITY_DN1971_c0_g1~~TRINITY_DN1971_c0_g1_i1.p1  ORF type:complete len:301 (-),score=112.54 TRINITY_DN1971_c0_g1_i1:542-1420(-)
MSSSACVCASSAPSASPSASVSTSSSASVSASSSSSISSSSSSSSCVSVSSASKSLQVGKALLSRLLYPNPLCLLTSTESKLHFAEPKRNVMTITWLTAISNVGEFICSMNAGRDSTNIVLLTKRFVLNVPVQGMESLVLGIGGCTGRDVDKFSFFHIPLCRPGWRSFTQADDDKQEGKNKNEDKPSEEEMKRREAVKKERELKKKEKEVKDKQSEKGQQQQQEKKVAVSSNATTTTSATGKKKKKSKHTKSKLNADQAKLEAEKLERKKRILEQKEKERSHIQLKDKKTQR